MFILLPLLGVLVCVVLIYAYVSTNTRQWKLIQKFPGKPTLPLIGNGHQLGLDPNGVNNNMFKIWEEVGRTNFRLALGVDTFVMVCKPNDIESILGSTDIIEKPKLYQVFETVFGDGIVIAGGQKWRTMRKLLQPAFHFKVMEKHFMVMKKQSHKLVETLKPQLNKGSFDVDPYLRNFTFDVICGTNLGIELNAQDNPEQPYTIAAVKLFHLVTKRWFSLWKRNDFLYKFSSDFKQMKELLKDFHGFSEKIIKERKEFLKDVLRETKADLTSEDSMVALAEKGYHSLIDLLILSKLSDGTPIPDKNIRDEIDIILFAGHDTTAATLEFTLFNLAKYPEMQERVLEEQRSIFHDDYNRDPTSQDLNEMKYLERCIKETMRVHTPVSQYARLVTKDVVMEDGNVIPAGASVIIFTPGLYFNPEVYPDPYVFNPDRYLEPIHPYALVPFAAGPRICIGMRYAWMEMKTALSIVLRNYEFVLEGPHMEPTVVRDIVIKSKDGIKLMLRERVRDTNI